MHLLAVLCFIGLMASLCIQNIWRRLRLAVLHNFPATSREPSNTAITAASYPAEALFPAASIFPCPPNTPSPQLTKGPRSCSQFCPKLLTVTRCRFRPTPPGLRSKRESTSIWVNRLGVGSLKAAKSDMLSWSLWCTFRLKQTCRMLNAQLI